MLNPHDKCPGKYVLLEIGRFFSGCPTCPCPWVLSTWIEIVESSAFSCIRQDDAIRKSGGLALAQGAAAHAPAWAGRVLNRARTQACPRAHIRALSQ